MTVHLVYIEATLLLVFSMSFKACQVKQVAQISLLFYYDSEHMQYSWTEHIHVDGVQVEPLTAYIPPYLPTYLP